MKIGIDARLYGTKHRGIGRYSQKLIEFLEKIDQENQYVIFMQKDSIKEYQPKNKNFKKVLANYRVYSWQEQLLLPLKFYWHRLNLVHFTHFNVSFLYRKKRIITIHDLIISHYPDSRATTLPPFMYKLKLFFYNLLVNSSARSAQKIIAVSKYTKEDIVKTLKVDEKKIEVIYEGVDFPDVGSAGADELLQGLGITKKFFLYVGAAYPHKNLEKLVLAFQKLYRQRQDCQLVLVGKMNFFYQRLKKFIEKGEQLAGGNSVDKESVRDIILTDYLSDEELVSLYKKARVYVFPSLIEGFGLPPLEAQHYGLAVISSKNTCLPEVLGDSAIYFDPQSIDDMSAKMLATVDNEQIKQELVAKGYENLKKYSWQAAASQTHDIYLGFKK
ncbi:MAG: glycosyltransferase family 1 protein [Patescibacteria group bacterium]